MDSNSRSPVRDYAFRDAPLIIPAIRSRGKNRFLCRRQRHPRPVGTKATAIWLPALSSGSARERGRFAARLDRGRDTRPRCAERQATACRDSSSLRLARHGPGRAGQAGRLGARAPAWGPKVIGRSLPIGAGLACRTAGQHRWISRSLAFVSSRIDDDERRDPQAARENFRPRSRKSSSQRTRRRRGMDSNARSPASGTTISRPPRSSASSRSAL
jgi:hypothetical protein